MVMSVAKIYAKIRHMIRYGGEGRRATMWTAACMVIGGARVPLAQLQQTGQAWFKTKLNSCDTAGGIVTRRAVS